MSTCRHADSVQRRACVSRFCFACFLARVAVAVRLDDARGYRREQSRENDSVADPVAEQPEHNIDYLHDLERMKSYVASASNGQVKKEEAGPTPGKEFTVLASFAEGTRSANALTTASSSARAGKVAPALELAIEPHPLPLVDIPGGGLGDQASTVSASAAPRAAESIYQVVGELQSRVPAAIGDESVIGGAGGAIINANEIPSVSTLANVSTSMQQSANASKQNSTVRAEQIFPTNDKTSGIVKPIPSTTPSQAKATATLGVNSSTTMRTASVERERKLTSEGEDMTLEPPKDDTAPFRIAYCRRSVIRASHVLDHLEHDCGSAKPQKEAALVSKKADPTQTVMDALIAKLEAASGDISRGRSLLEKVLMFSGDNAESDDAFHFERADQGEESDAYDVETVDQGSISETAGKPFQLEKVALREAFRRLKNGLWDQTSPGRLIVQSATETEASLRKRWRAYQVLRNGTEALIEKTRKSSLKNSSKAAVKEKLLSIAVGNTCHKKLMTRKWLKQEIRDHCPDSKPLSWASLVELESFIEQNVDVDDVPNASTGVGSTSIAGGELLATHLQQQQRKATEQEHQLKSPPTPFIQQASVPDVEVGTAVLAATAASNVSHDTVDARTGEGGTDSSQLKEKATRSQSQYEIGVGDTLLAAHHDWSKRRWARLGDYDDGLQPTDDGIYWADAGKQGASAVALVSGAERSKTMYDVGQSSQDNDVDDGVRWPGADSNMVTVEAVNQEDLNQMVKNGVPAPDAAGARIEWVLSSPTNPSEAPPEPTPAPPTFSPTPMPTETPTIEPTQPRMPAAVPPTDMQTTTPEDGASTTDDDSATTTTSTRSASDDGAGTTTTSAVHLTRRDRTVASFAASHAEEEHHTLEYEALLRNALDRLQRASLQEQRIRRKLQTQDSEAKSGEDELWDAAVAEEPGVCGAMTCDGECSIQEGSQLQRSTCRSRILVQQEGRSLKQTIEIVNANCHTQCCCSMMEFSREANLLASGVQLSELSRTETASATAASEATVETAEVHSLTDPSLEDDYLAQFQPMNDSREDADYPEEDRLPETDDWEGLRGRGKGSTMARHKHHRPSALSTHPRNRRHRGRRKRRTQLAARLKRRYPHEMSGEALASALLAIHDEIVEGSSHDGQTPDAEEKQRLAYVQEFLALTDETESKRLRRAGGEGTVHKRPVEDDFSDALLDMPPNKRSPHMALSATSESAEWCRLRGELLEEIEVDLRDRCPQAVIEDASLEPGVGNFAAEECSAKEKQFDRLLSRISSRCNECPKVSPGRCDEKCAGRTFDGVDFVSTCRSLVLSVSLDGPQGAPIETAICDVNRVCAPQCGCAEADFLDTSLSDTAEVATSFSDLAEENITTARESTASPMTISTAEDT